MFLLFFLVWIVFNGNITVEIAIIGLAVAAAVFAFICKFMDYGLKKEILLYKKLLAFIGYVIILIIEIIKANIAVIHMIVTQREVVEPVIVRFRTSLRTETARVILANSITLTPGTITVSLEGDEYEVHCLDKSLAEGIEDSMFVKLLEKMEGKEK